jgi:hypothetical protein
MKFFIMDPPNVSTFSEKSLAVNKENGYILKSTENILTISLEMLFKKYETAITKNG